MEKILSIFLLALVLINYDVNASNTALKTSEVKLKVFADRIFDNLVTTKDQNSNKTRMNELKIAFEKIKQNPIRFLDLLITIGKNNKALSDEALKIIDFSQFDQCIIMLIDLILQRLDYWMQIKSTTMVPTTGLNGVTTTGSSGSPTNSGNPSTGGPTTTLGISPGSTFPNTASTTLFQFTPSPIRTGLKKLKDTVLIDPLYCNNFNRNDCSVPAPGQPVNLIPFICKTMCSCQNVVNCSNNGIPVLNSAGQCRCACGPGFRGDNCQITDREFCFASLKPSCTDPLIRLACPTLCS